jgi:hypothetical protein
VAGDGGLGSTWEGGGRFRSAAKPARTEVLPVRKDFAAAENSFRFGNTQDQEANVPAGNIRPRERCSRREHRRAVSEVPDAAAHRAYKALSNQGSVLAETFGKLPPTSIYLLAAPGRPNQQSAARQGLIAVGR